MFSYYWYNNKLQSFCPHKIVKQQVIIILPPRLSSGCRRMTPDTLTCVHFDVTPHHISRAVDLFHFQGSDSE